MKSWLAAALLLVVPVGAGAQDGAKSWEGWDFLIGDWISAPGQAGAGSMSLHFDLDQKVILKRGHADVPATKDRPASSHDDLMLLYPEAGGKTTRAEYFDNEGHVIRYRGELHLKEHTLTLTSEGAAQAPHFRLIFRGMEKDQLKVTFQIAPPGPADAYRTYTEGTVVRKPSR